MNLMKWFRKNNKKLMAVVVIVLMIAFIGGSSFSYIFEGSGGASKAVAHYGYNHKKISGYDRAEANRELEVLSALRADVILQNQDLRGLLLSELLFSQNRSSGMVLDMARQDIQRNRYRISDKQLSDVYRDRNAPPDIYWLLLREEATTVGIYVRPEDVGELLGAIISNPNSLNLFGTNSYAQVMQGLTDRFNVSESYVLTTFGKLLAVHQYAQAACAVENVTGSQIRHIASREAETVNAEFVRLEASSFADKSQTPPDEAVAEQFNKYKTEFPGTGGAANPFGFGYKLPDLVQFDYIVLQLPDVESIIKPPTQEEAEQYYQQNRTQLYAEQVPSNPSDPNSPMVSRPKSYAAVADSVMSELRRQKIITKAEQILEEARNIADAKLAPESEGQVLTLAQRQGKALDYTAVAQELGKKHNLTLYSGRTGLLNGLTMQSDKYLSRMFLTGYSYNPVRLSQVLFSVKELGENATILLGLPQAEMYASIGPARDPLVMRTPMLSNQIMMIARVVDARPAAAPENLDVAFSTQTLALGDPSEQKNKTFSVKDEVIKDLRKMAAWETTRGRAQEFLALATKDGWDKAINQFNQLYGAQAKADPNDPNVFKQDQVMGLQRLSAEGFQVLAAQVSNNPAADVILNEAKAEGQFANQLYTLAAAADDTTPVPPQVLEFKPNQSFYVLKSLSREHLTREDFQRMKAMVLRQEEHNQIQNLAVVHLNPENILKRMNFEFVRQADEPAAQDAQKQEESAS